MKKVAVFLLLTSCLSVLAKVNAQKVTFSGTDVELQIVFDAIQKQTGYGVFIEDVLLKQTKTVTIHLKDVTIEDLLKACLKSQPINLDLYFAGRSIIIKKRASSEKNERKSPPLVPIDIHGQILDESNKPISSVTVMVKGIHKSTTSNDNGEFQLSGIPDNAKITISGINIETKELYVNGQTNLSIHVANKIVALQDITVQVSTGYQQINKERFVGSVTKVDSALFHREVSTDLISRLDGITNSLLFDKRFGTPQLQLRGISTLGLTLTNPTQPLIIVDNFPYAGDISNINPQDVEDITLLKDAAATSIWGAKASNGVIVINTKKGKFNHPLQVSFTSNIRIQEKPDLFYFPQMKSSDFIDVEQFLFNQGFYDASLTDPTMPIVSPVVEILNQEKTGSITASEAETRINALRPLDIRNQFNKYVFKKPIYQQDYLSFSGGTSQVKYQLSMGFDRNSTQIKDNGSYSRYSITSNTSYKPIKTLELTAGINFSQSVTKPDGITYPLTPGSSKSIIYPYAQLADAQGNSLAVPNLYRPSFIDTVQGLLDWHYRPLDEMKLIDSRTRTQFYQINLGANLRLTSWLNADIKYQHIQQTIDAKNIQNQQSFAARDVINTFTQIGTSLPTLIVPIGGILSKSQNELISNNVRGQLNFNKTWNANNELSGIIAGEINENKTTSFSDRIYGYDPNTLSYSPSIDYLNYYPTYFGGYAQIPSGLSVNEFLTRSASLLANASYTYDKRYTFYASARRDGANIFGVNTNNKWKPLWSFGGAWNIANESFYHLTWFPMLRVRASYGYTGNSNNTIPTYTTIAYNSSLSYYTHTQTATIISPPNPDLKWEETRTTNLGLDFSAFENRLTGTLEWFEKKSNNVIAPFPVDPTTGVSGSFINKNAANLKTNGVDFQLTSNNLKGDIKWVTSLNFNYAKTIVTKYYQDFVTAPVNFPGINPHSGQIAYGLYSYRWAGLDPLTGAPQGYLAKTISKDYIGIQNDSFRNQAFSGSSIPLYFGNILNSFSYKGLSFSFNIAYRLGYYFRRPTINYDALFNNWMGNADYSKRWQKPGDEKVTNVPSLSYPSDVNRDNFYAYSEATIEKADNIRIQDTRISYDWNNKRFTKLPIQHIQFFLYAGNLNMVIWKASRSKFDPDYTGSSLSLPPSKVYTAGINVTL